MEDDKLEEELPQEEIVPFVKLSQIQLHPLEKKTGVPVKFRRNIFEEGPMVPGAPDRATTGEAEQIFHKPARHMRAQPRLPYSTLDPEERRQAEILDTAAARQQLLLRQQQEVMAHAHRQQVEQQAQQIVNRSLATGTTSTTPADKQPQADRQKLNTLLNEACILAPHSLQVQPQAFKLHTGMAWTPPQPALTNQGYYNPMTVLTNQAAPVTAGHPPGAPGGYTMMGQDELILAVRKELKRMQQE